MAPFEVKKIVTGLIRGNREHFKQNKSLKLHEVLETTPRVVLCRRLHLVSFCKAVAKNKTLITFLFRITLL